MCNFQNMMDLNYFGSVFATRAVIEEMKSRRHGRIVFLSSQAGQMGLYGFTGYSATKFALRGLAEALQMEVSQLQTIEKLQAFIISRSFVVFVFFTAIIMFPNGVLSIVGETIRHSNLCSIST